MVGPIAPREKERPWVLSGGTNGEGIGVINLLRCPACFRTAIGEIFLADGFVQCRTNSAEIRSDSENAVFPFIQAGAHLIWVSEVIRFCIPPVTVCARWPDRATLQEVGPAMPSPASGLVSLIGRLVGYQSPAPISRRPTRHFALSSHQSWEQHRPPDHTR